MFWRSLTMVAGFESGLPLLSNEDLVTRAIKKRPPAQSEGSTVRFNIHKRKKPSQLYIMQGKEFILGLAESRHPSFGEIVERLTRELNEGTLAGKDVAKDRLAVLLDEMP